MDLGFKFCPFCKFFRIIFGFFITHFFRRNEDLPIPKPQVGDTQEKRVIDPQNPDYVLVNRETNPSSRFI